MRSIKAILVVLLLAVFVSGCTLPWAAKTIPTPVKQAAAIKTPIFGATQAVPTTAPTQSYGSPKATPGIKYDVTGKDAAEKTPAAGEALVCGKYVYTLTYPGTKTAGIGIWFWIAKQYGGFIPEQDMTDPGSKYTQAYLYWIGTSKSPVENFTWSTYKTTGDTFKFYLPC